MNTTASAMVIGDCLVDADGLGLESFTLVCGTEPGFIRLLVNERLLQPTLN